ncbi:hypothetical protein Q31a_07820 [Aureliella helgolandensis]|uniref:Uncharacterized protein n=1 Tax=Aureliella helgolandensis TaxID=2527968 RepID=A0A518G1M6_9BACT|nr:hypothetical protein Q31a_07820 [Aureliella helgolandensis]
MLEREPCIHFEWMNSAIAPTLFAMLAYDVKNRPKSERATQTFLDRVV